VLIAGRFTGKIRAGRRVEIQASAVVTGDIQTPCLMIEPGGVFDGHCFLPTATEEAVPITIPIRSVSVTTEVPT
jgi:cytoskeletal protein CcmA (bactofilin family)